MAVFGILKRQGKVYTVVVPDYQNEDADAHYL